MARLAAWTFLATAWAIKDLIELHDAAIELEERASHGEHLTKQEKELIHKEAAKMLSESRHRQQYQPHQPEPHPHAAGGSVRRQRSLINSFN